MNHAAANKELLSSKIPGLQEALERYEPDADFTIVPTPSGLPSALYRGVSVHSRRDPLKEAAAIVAREIDGAVSVGVFLGFGLGYTAERFILAHPDAPCLVVEPDIGLFLRALEARDLSVVLNHPRVVFFLASEPTAVIRFLDTLDLSAVKVVKLRSLFEKDRAYYERTDALIRSFLSQQDVNRNTLRRFGRLWVRNLAQNVRLLCSAPGVNSIADLFTGLPALVCAGGPSLERVLPSLRELRARCLIIAVDTTLAALQRAGVDPDFTVVCDPQYWNTRHLDPVKKTDSVIVSESSTHPRIFRRLGERVFFGGSVFPLGRYLESLVGEKGKLGAGGSVATTAWDCARHLGCSPVYMAGLDLGFPEGKTHFHGAHFEEVFFGISTRLKPQSHHAYAYLRDAGPFPAADNSGGLVLTDHRMAVYKFWFETQMSLHPELPTYNLSASGVRIEGMPFAELAALKAMPEQRNEITARLAKLLAFQPENGDNRSGLAALRRGIGELLGELEKTAAVAGEGIRAAQSLKLKRGRGEPAASLLKRLDEIDRKIAALASRNIAGFLAGPLIHEINRTSERGTDPARWLDLSLDLYRELEDSSRYHLSELRKALASLSPGSSETPS